jgi:phosphatidate cytidylyltransferase
VKSNLALRVISAVVLLPIVLAIVHVGGWYIYGLCLLACGITLWEYGGIVSQQDGAARLALVAVGTTAAAFAMRTPDPAVALLSVQLAAIVLAVTFLLRTGDDFDSAWPRLAALAFGLLYVTLAMTAVYRLRSLGDVYDYDYAKPTWLYVVLIATWSNDTFAYFAGRAFGKHKLYEKVSPKKTWEGFAGGAVGSVAMLFAARAAFPNAFEHFTAVDLLFIGVPAAALAPAGDLAESLLKRNYKVKDSGNTIPGHGGMLDRVDAVYFVAPWVMFYAAGIRPMLVG